MSCFATYRALPCACSSSKRLLTRSGLFAQGVRLHQQQLHALASHRDQQSSLHPQPRDLQQQQQLDQEVTVQALGPAGSCGLGGRHEAAASTAAAGWMQNPGMQVTLAAAVALLALGLTSQPAAAAEGMQHHSSIQPIMDIAEGEEFWGNVAKYGRYFVTVMLGTGYVMVQPLLAAFKRPVTAVLAIVGIGGGFVLLRFVLNAMLGVQEPFDYEPGSIVPYS